MQNAKKQFVAALGLVALSAVAFAGSNPMVGGKEMFPNKDIIDNAVNSDEKGGMSTVTIANVNQSNGVIHVVDTVLMPN